MIVHRRGAIETFSYKHVFDVDRVSPLIDIDQRHMFPTTSLSYNSVVCFFKDVYRKTKAFK